MEKQNKYCRTIFLAILGLCLPFLAMGQNEPPPLSDQLRVNILNPGIDYEMAISNSTAISFGAGIGYFGSFSELTVGPANGFIYIIAPFADVQYKWLYNRAERNRKGKSLAHNSGNFMSLRGFWKGGSLAENVTRTDKNDFFVGITWGFQRSIGKKIHLLFDIGPVYYFDTVGNSGFFPFLAQLNIGLNLSKPK